MKRCYFHVLFMINHLELAFNVDIRCDFCIIDMKSKF